MPAQVVAGSPRRTRQIRAAVTLLLTLAFLGVAFYKAYSYIQEDTRSPAAAAADCTIGSAAKPSDTVVNVYNASKRPGLAADVARQLRERGYQVGDIDNDPLKKKVTDPAVIRYGKPGLANARAARLAIKAAKYKQDDRTDTSVDLVLGDSFKALNPQPSCSAKA